MAKKEIFLEGISCVSEDPFFELPPETHLCQTGEGHTPRERHTKEFYSPDAFPLFLPNTEIFEDFFSI